MNDVQFEAAAIKATGQVLPASARQVFTVQRTGDRWKLLHYMFQEVPKD